MPASPARSWIGCSRTRRPPASVLWAAVSAVGRGSTCFFCKGPDSKHFRLLAPHVVSVLYSSLFIFTTRSKCNLAGRHSRNRPGPPGQVPRLALILDHPWQVTAGDLSRYVFGRTFTCVLVGK